MDDNKHPQTQQTQASKETQKGNVNQKTGPVASKRIFAKRWMYPAIYLGAAALIIGLMYIKSQSGGSAPTAGTNVDVGTTTGQNTPAAESFMWPAAQSANAKVTMAYFSDKASDKDQAAALVLYDGGYYAHQGYDIQAQNKKAFDVVAAASGTVTHVVTNDQVNGKTVEVKTADGYTVRYASLGDVKVKEGDQIKQGQTIGTSGTCAFEKAQGNHLYFEVSKSNKTVDPATLLPSQQ